MAPRRQKVSFLCFLEPFVEFDEGISLNVLDLVRFVCVMFKDDQSFGIITSVEDLIKDGATNRFHMIAFFKTMHSLQKTRYNVPFDSNMHLIDNASVTRCKQFLDMVAKD